MAERDASRVQLDFPQLTADIIAQLRLTGVVGLLDFLDQIRPVYIVASRAGALALTADLPLFASAQITSGAAANPAANTVIGDTGALPAGDYDIFASISMSGLVAVGLNTLVALQHRDAADAATLATLLTASYNSAANLAMPAQLPLTGYTIALDERFRFINIGSSLTGHISTVVGARLRSTP